MALTVRCIRMLAFCLSLTNKFSVVNGMVVFNSFYPFGTDVGDTVVPPSDDGSSGLLRLTIDMPFYNTTYNTLAVCTNGIISFVRPLTDYTPLPFPILRPAYAMLAPYWADANTNVNNGRVYYRELNESQGSALLTRVTADIRLAFSVDGFASFEARWMFIATWHNVTFPTELTNKPLNSFQAVLASDLFHTFVFFNYGNLSWTCGPVSGGDRNGLCGNGGIGAEVGYNSGYPEFWFADKWSLTDDILNVVNTSNLAVDGWKGRRAYRIDNNYQLSVCQKVRGKCAHYQQYNAILNTCPDVAPQFTCPVLSGPAVINRLWFEFYCTVQTNLTDATAMFDVEFLFDGQPAGDVPVFTVSAAGPRAVLHEQYINAHMGTSLTCRVTSYWQSTSSVRSISLYSTEDPYFLGLKLSTNFVQLTEADALPYKVQIMSRLPITCPDVASASRPEPCSLQLQIVMSNAGYLAIRQLYPGQDQIQLSCTFVIMETDWNLETKLAFNSSAPLEIIAQIDPYITSVRFTQILLKTSLLPLKTINGLTYKNPWDNKDLQPRVFVYRYDVADALSTCSSSGDPHLVTFDGLAYSTYSTGTFIYSQSTSGLPFQVQVRHRPCSGPTISCVCGVAVQEDDVILIADMCNPDSIMHYITFNAKDLPPGSNIYHDKSTRNIKIQVPSGTRIYGVIYSWNSLMVMDIRLVVVGKKKLQGMCGYRNSNPNDDLNVYGTNTYILSNQLYDGQPNANFTASWQVPNGQTLFDGTYYQPEEPDPLHDSLLTFCQCTANGTLCGGPAVANQNYPGDPPILTNPMVPVLNNNAGKRKRRETSTNNLQQSQSDVSYDSTYNPAQFPYNSVSIVTLTAPTPVLQRVDAACRDVILNPKNIGQACAANISTTDANQIIDKCIKDVVLTGSDEWIKDKVADIQKTCLFNTLTRNNSDVNDTTAAIDAIINEVNQQLLPFSCSPFDCSGNGVCINGSCQCTSDYIGADCAISKYARPSVDGVIDTLICDVTQSSCSNVNVLMVNASSVATLACQIVATYVDGYKETYVTKAQLTSLRTVRCNLPPEMLRFFTRFANFSQYKPGFDFNCFFPGSWLVNYTVAVSNDGINFGSSQSASVADTTCVDCSNGFPCQPKPGTCLINGYCFASGDSNPYLPSCYQCQPATSQSSWTLVQGASSSSCVATSLCQPEKYCIPLRSNAYPYICIQRCSCASCTEPSTTKTTSTTTTTTMSTSATTTTSTTTTIPANCNATWSSPFNNTNIYGGTSYRSARSLSSCQAGCVSISGCSGIDWDPSNPSQLFCYLILANASGIRGGALGVTHYDYLGTICSATTASTTTTSSAAFPSLTSTTISRTSSTAPTTSASTSTLTTTAATCNTTWSSPFDNTIVFGGTYYSSARSLGSCQAGCVSISGCSGIDWDPNNPQSQFCYLILANASGIRLSGGAPGVTHYDYLGTICSVRPMCNLTWSVPYINTNVLGGTAVSTAVSIRECQAACADSSSCNGIDYNNNNRDAACFLTFPYLTARNNGTASGITHYDVLSRNCS